MRVYLTRDNTKLPIKEIFQNQQEAGYYKALFQNLPFGLKTSAWKGGTDKADARRGCSPLGPSFPAGKVRALLDPATQDTINQGALKVTDEYASL